MVVADIAAVSFDVNQNYSAIAPFMFCLVQVAADSDCFQIRLGIPGAIRSVCGILAVVADRCCLVTSVGLEMQESSCESTKLASVVSTTVSA